jgi:hypothetical protein
LIGGFLFYRLLERLRDFLFGVVSFLITLRIYILPLDVRSPRSAEYIPKTCRQARMKVRAAG